MKYRVYLDTNKLYTDKHESFKEVFNSNISKIRKFLDENKAQNVELLLPEIVFKERIQQKLEEIHFSVNSANNNIEKLTEVGHKTKKIAFRKNYKKLLTDEAKEFLRKNKVVLSPVPQIDSDVLIERALQKIKPFKSADTGFKDTLIFLTLINDAVKDPNDIYILCTNNTLDFNDNVKKQFNEETGKELIIVNEIIDLQQKLDELIPLRQKLKELYLQIEEDVKKRTGTLVVKVNESISNNVLHFSDWGTQEDLVDRRLYTDIQNPIFRTEIHPVSVFAVGTYPEKEKKILGYDFKDISFSNIEKKSDYEYNVDVIVTVTPQYEKENVFRVTSSYRDIISLRGNNKRFKISLRYDKKSGDIIILSCKEDLFY